MTTRKTLKEWSTIMEAQEQSGLGLGEYSKREGINYKGLTSARRRLRKRGISDQEKNPAFKNEPVFKLVTPIHFDLPHLGEAPKKTNQDMPTSHRESHLGSGQIELRRGEVSIIVEDNCPPSKLLILVREVLCVC